MADYADLKARILLSAIEEFGRHGYDNASTNMIVHNAGVSKGLLFHYYGSKENLFLACLDFMSARVEKYIYGCIDFSDTDLFNRIRQSLHLKMRFCRENLMLMELACKLWDSENRFAIEKHLHKFTGDAALDPARGRGSDLPDYSFSFLLRDTDMTKFNEGVSVEKLIDCVGVLLSASWNRFAGKYDNDAYRIADHTEEYLAEADAFLMLIQCGAYKSERDR